MTCDTTPHRPSQTTQSPFPSSLQAAKTVAHACQDAKGKDVQVLDVSSTFGLADYFVIVSGRSDRHVQGISNRILMGLDLVGITPSAIEGFDDGHWILMDCGDVIVHIFYEPLRSHYDIEGLWLLARPVDIPQRDHSLRAA